MISKRSLLVAAFFALCIVLLLAPEPSLAREDAVPFSKNQVQSYLEKYKIAYDKNMDDSTLLQTVKSYRDAAAYNMQMFGHKVERLMEGLKIKLQKHYNLGEKELDELTDELQHHLRQLELRGELTRDKVRQRLDQLENKVIRQKIVTHAQWKEIVNDLEGSFESQDWYQKFLGRHDKPATSSDFQPDAYHHWLKNVVTDRFQHNKELTRQQVQAIQEGLQHSLSSASDALTIGDPAFYRRLQHDVSRRAQLNKQQAADVLESLKSDVNAYKIFAMDYCGRHLGPQPSWLMRIRTSLQEVWLQMVDWWECAKQRVNRVWPRAGPGNAVVETGPVASIRSAASSVSQDWEKSSRSAARSRTVRSVLHAASDSAASAQARVTHAKESFAHYWHKKERDAWRKLGYTEAQIDWVFRHLTQSFRDQTSYAQHNVDRVLTAIRNYLKDAKVQSATQVERQINQVERLLEAWKKTLPTSRDEL